jgi:hypothetical protein
MSRGEKDELIEIELMKSTEEIDHEIFVMYRNQTTLIHHLTIFHCDVLNQNINSILKPTKFFIYLQSHSYLYVPQNLSEMVLLTSFGRLIGIFVCST